MYKTIKKSINFTSIEEFEQTCKKRVIDYSTVTPISIISTVSEDDDYWCRVLKVNSTTVVEKYVFVWNKILHDWKYVYDVFVLTITD